MLRRLVLPIDCMLPISYHFNDKGEALPLKLIVHNPTDENETVLCRTLGPPKQGSIVLLTAPFMSNRLVTQILLTNTAGNALALWPLRKHQYTQIVDGDRWRLEMALHPDTDRTLQPWAW